MSRFFFFFIFLSSFASNAQTERFFCDYLGVYQIDKGNHSNESMDRIFSYKKENDRYRAQFPLQSEGSFAMKLNRDILSGFYTVFAREQKGFYRESFNVYRMNVKTGLLVRSHVYYVSKEDFEKNFKDRGKNPYSIPFSKEPFKFFDKEPPEGYVKIGWDKASWQCHKISFFKYILYGLKEIIFQIHN